MRVLVFGCGPAGLMAAHAAAVLDHDVIVVSKKRKSEMFGCQYLHRAIPHVTPEDSVEVSYTLRGTPEGYREKVYGKGGPLMVSPEDLEETHLAWDLRRTYDNLWNAYGRYVINDSLDAAAVQRLLFTMQPDFVFNTVPLPGICDSDHAFTSEAVWAVGDAPERGIFAPNPLGLSDNEIVCDGTRDVSWYRSAHVFGYHTLEWSTRGPKPPIEGVTAIEKPLSSTCTCWQGQVVNLGRYGKWQKGVLSHTAFFDAHAILARRGHQEALDLGDGA